MVLVAAITVEVETAVPVKMAAAEMVAASPAGAACTALAEITATSHAFLRRVIAHAEREADGAEIFFLKKPQ
jgi:hypothetical protein